MTESPKCPDCNSDTEYQGYTVRVGGSHPLHVFKCPVCEKRKVYHLQGPSKQDGGVYVHNN